MASKVTLFGVARRRQQFQLPHDDYCVPSGDCRCQMVTVRTLELDPKTGAQLPRVVTNKVPGTIVVHHKAGVTMDKAVLACPGVKAAIYSKPKRLRLT